MTIISDFHAPVGDDGALLSEKHIGRHERSQRRAPKKVHKAEREKLKREHLNDLFLELGHALEPGRHNSGKASVLGDATRLLREMISQVESLRRENASLATESRFVAMEKNELRDENLALEQEIQRLQEELKEKGRSKPAWRGGAEVAPPQPSTAAAAAVVGPVYVFPINQELAAYSTEPAAAGSPPKPPSQVARPHARYPTPADSWPGQILTLQLRPPETQDDQHGGGGDGAGSDGAGTSTSSSSGGGGRTEGC